MFEEDVCLVCNGILKLGPEGVVCDNCQSLIDECEEFFSDNIVNYEEYPDDNY